MASRLGFELTQASWDRQFRRWIRKAQRDRKDPNDVGDVHWGDPAESLQLRYLPHITADDVVVELGPGTGRYSRHLIDACKQLILVDNSPFVCRYLERYFAGKPTVTVIRARDWRLEEVASGSAGFAFANGVFEHLDQDVFLGYLTAFARILRPGGRCVFNFNNVVSAEALRWFRESKPPVHGRSVFRFYHPETVRTFAAEAGLEVEDLATSEHRFGFATLRRPMAS
jgi:SAM-dependent methyltransferase